MANRNQPKDPPFVDDGTTTAIDAPPRTVASDNAINAPERTGAQGPISDAEMDDRRPTLGKSITSAPFGEDVEDEVEQRVQEHMKQAYVEQEAMQRAAAQRAEAFMANINTDNPYRLKEGESPVYQMGKHLIDPHGRRVGKASFDAGTTQERFLDESRKLKEM